MECNKLLDKFYEEYHHRNYEKAIELLKKVWIIEVKGSFWLYSRLSSCYYELRDYDTALVYAKKAYKLKPNSPLVLWDYAGVLIMLKKEKRGIKLLQRIQSMDDDLRNYGFADADIKWMQSLKNDANFLIGKAYYIIYEDSLAKDFLLKHLSGREAGRKSIYSKNKALSYLKKLD